jgi:methyl-accepting chemotaxis protein
VLVYLLDGHPWQMEGHMYFFAGLAAVSLACDWRPVLTATLLIAAHHLLLSWLAPAALFMGNHYHLDRVLIHAVAVLIVCALLTRTIGHLVRSFVDQEKTMAERDEAACLAQQERERCDVLQASRSAIAVRP